MADNTTLNPGSGGDVIRDIARSTGASLGAKTQIVGLDLGGVETNPEFLFNAGPAPMAESIPVVPAWDAPSDASLIEIRNLLLQLVGQPDVFATPFERLAQSIRSIFQENAPPAALPAVVTPLSATSLVIKQAPGFLYDASVCASALVYLMAFNATSVPPDGTVTPALPPLIIQAGSTGGLSFAGVPPAFFSVGICLAVSSTGPFIKTTPAGTYFISGRAL